LFICCIYRLLTLGLTEGDLQKLFHSHYVYVRCAGHVLVRIGVSHERHWDLLNHALLDDEEFVPFPLRDNKGEIVGKFVENLLAKDKYCNIALPRIPIATRNQINRQLALYRQFRQRYTANCAVIDWYTEPKVEVEVCSTDGEWSRARTIGQVSPGDRRVTARLRFKDGTERSVSLGMVICPGNKDDRQDWDREDLRCERGRSMDQLMEELVQEQRENAVAKGTDYFRGSKHVTINPLGGVPIVAGMKRKDQNREYESESEDEDDKRNRLERTEHMNKMAAITARYCAGAPDYKTALEATKAANSNDVDRPARMRLG